MDVTLRPAISEDTVFVQDMLWEATAVDADMRALGREGAMLLPSARTYLDDWGRHGDAALVALDRKGRRLGAAWYRLFPPDAGAMASWPRTYRNSPLAWPPGHAATEWGQHSCALQATARAQGFVQMRMSVDRQISARALYERLGLRGALVSAPDDSPITFIAAL